MKYTLGRVGLFALVAVVLLPLRLNLFLTLMIALLVSMVLSYVLLRKWREEFAVQIADGARKRHERKEQLRAALAGEEFEAKPAPDEAAPGKAPSTSERRPRKQDDGSS